MSFFEHFSNHPKTRTKKVNHDPMPPVPRAVRNVHWWVIGRSLHLHVLEQ